MAARMRVPAARSLTCSTAKALLQARLDHELAPVQAARLDCHLAGCLSCRREAEAMMRLAQALASLRPVSAPERVRAGLAGANAARPLPAPLPRLPAGGRALLRGRLAVVGAMVAVVLGAMFLPGLLRRYSPPVKPGAAPSGTGDGLSHAAGGPSPSGVGRAVASLRHGPIRPVHAVRSGEEMAPVFAALSTARPRVSRPELTSRARELAYDREVEEELRAVSERDPVIKAATRVARLVESLEPPPGLAAGGGGGSPEPAVSRHSGEVPEDVVWATRVQGAAERVRGGPSSAPTPF